MLKRVGESRHPCRTPNFCSEPVSHAAVEEDCLVTEVFDDSDKVGAGVVLHVCPQSCMQNHVEGLLEVYEDMAEVLLVLEIFLTENAQVEGPKLSISVVSHLHISLHQCSY